MIEEYVGGAENSLFGGRSQKARTARSAKAATAQAMSSRRLRDAERANTVPDAAAESGWEMDWSSSARSRADCHRSSGSFARHRRTTWSRLRGVRGLMELMGVGSFSRMAEATLSWLLPSNAR